MFDHEKTTPDDFLNQISKKIIGHQQTQLSGSRKEALNFMHSLRLDVQTLLTMYSSNTFHSVNEAFVLEFLSRFCQPYLQPESVQQIQSQLSVSRQKFPQLIRMNNQIRRISRQLFNIDSELTPLTTISVPKTDITEENVVISTFMKTMVVKREFYKKIGTTRAIPLTYTESETSFNLNPTT